MPVFKVQEKPSFRIASPEEARYKVLIHLIGSHKNTVICLIVLMFLANIIGVLDLFIIQRLHDKISFIFNFINFLLIDVGIIINCYSNLINLRTYRREAEKLDPNRIDLKRKFYGN